MTYDLIVHFAEDYGGDEPRLEFAFIGGSTHPEVQVLDTGRLATDYHPMAVTSGSSTTPPLTTPHRLGRSPTGASDLHHAHRRGALPRFCSACDRERQLSGSDRRRDQRRLKQRLEEGLEPAFLTSTPTATDIWVLANSLPLIDNFGDDDDRIGVSARAYPTLGRGLQDRPSGGELLTDNRDKTLRFSEDDAHWQMNFGSSISR